MAGFLTRAGPGPGSVKRRPEGQPTAVALALGAID